MNTNLTISDVELVGLLSGDFFITKSGSKMWGYYKATGGFIPHRDGGPAIAYADGSASFWYKDGFLHREDGTAYQFNGMDHYYLFGIQLSKDIWMRDCAALRESSITKDAL